MNTDATTPSPDDQFLAECLRYLDGEMNEQGFVDFQSKLDTDPALQRRFVELNLLSEWIAESTGTERAEEVLAMADLVTRTQAIRSVTTADLKKVGGTEAFSLVVHLAWQTARTHTLAIGSIAAVLLMAVTLWFVFSSNSGSDVTEGPLAIEPNDPTVTSPAAAPIVAALTAEHEAKWERRPGEDLYAGQRITLIEGFAKITTNDGAIAILEAPVTVELIDHNNALRLHAGKLVGVCKTESSKGFLVRTPHMDVTDLGTQFGIDASSPDVSTVTVFEGEVVVSSAQTTDEPRQSVLLEVNEAISLNASGDVRRVEPDPLAFVQADEFDAIVRADASAAHRWYAYTARMRRDPDLLAFYTFEGLDNRAITNNTAAPNSELFQAQRGDGRDHTAPTRSADRFGRPDSALTFKREKMQALYVPDWHRAGPLDALTVSCWFKLEDNAGDWPLLVTQWHDAQDGSMSCAFHLGVQSAANNPNIPGQRMGLQAHVSHTGDRQSRLGWDVKHEARDGGATSPSDGWVHVALTIQCGGGPIRLYKNGVEVNANGANYEPALLPNPKYPLAIGGKSTYRGMDRSEILDRAISGFFQGEIDDVVLIGRALTQDDIQDMYRAGVAELD